MFAKVIVLAMSIGAIVAQDSRIWTIAYGHEWGPHEYFDESGYIRGFSSEIIAAVCEAAGMDCRTMWAPYIWCWNSDPGLHSYGGQGLVDRWVDACTGWFKTVDRSHVFDFSLPYLALESSFFFVKPGSSFDASDLSGKKIGFVQGWQADEKCLARQQSPERQNYILTKDQIVYTIGPEALYNAVISGQVDAAFNGYGGLADYVNDGLLEYIDDVAADCALHASAMMTRKDSDFNDYWNVGFEALKANGKFAQLCQDANDRHENQGTIKCIGIDV